MFSTTPLQKSILIASSLVFSSLALINTGYARAKSNPVFTITNNSSFYLNNQPQTAGCPSQIAPGQQGQSSQYWCGFVACATSQYDSNQGCMEWNGNKSALTQG